MKSMKHMKGREEKLHELHGKKLFFQAHRTAR